MTTPRTSCVLTALGTSVFLGVRHVGDLGTAQSLARAILTDVDETCSRFRPDSDLSRANRHAGRWVDVDPLLAAAVAVALEAARATDGLVDPLLGRPMVELGYDRDLRAVVARPDRAVGSRRLPTPTPGAWRDLQVDPDGAVRVPGGTALDLGATAKAWAADLIAAAFAEHLSRTAVVSVGGDLRVSAPDGDPWLIAVSEHPGAPPATMVAITGGAVATSSTQVRRWTSAGVVRHHLLDPHTGLPASGRWRTATVAAPTCVAANTASTAVLVDPAHLATRLMHDVPARLVDHDGVVHRTGGWPADVAAPTPTTETKASAA